MNKKLGRKTEREDEEKVDARFSAIARTFEGVRGVRAGKLFSSYGLKVNGKIFAMFGRERLVVKLPKDRVDELVSLKKAERFDPGHGRLMKEWAAFVDGDDEWLEPAREAYQFARRGKP